MFLHRLLPLSVNCRRFSTSPAVFKTFEEFKQRPVFAVSLKQRRKSVWSFGASATTVFTSMFLRRLLPLSVNCRRFSTSPAVFKTFEEFKQGYERDSSQRRRQSIFHLVRTIPVMAGIWVTLMIGIFYYWHCYYTYSGREPRRDVGRFSRFFGAIFMDYTKFAYNTDPDSP